MVEFHIKELRMSRGITQKELIERSGIRAATLSDYENNKATMIRVEHINTLCRILNCQVGDLITYKSSLEDKAYHVSHHIIKVPERENSLSKFVLEEVEKEISEKDKKFIYNLWIEFSKTLSREYEELDKRLQALEEVNSHKGD